MFLKIRMNSIGTKLTMAMAVMLFVSLTVLGCLNYFNAKSILISDAEEDLAHQTTGYAKEIGLWLQERRSEVSILANSPIVTVDNKEAGLNYLREEVKRNSAYQRFWIVDAQGKAIHTTGDRTNIADRAYFKQVMSTGKTFITDPIISKVDGKMVVSVVAPIKNNNQIVGVLGGTVPLDSLIKRIGEIKVAESGYAAVIQGDGLTIIHPDANLVMKNNPLTDNAANPRLKELTEKMIKGETGVSSYEANGATQYVAYNPIPGSTWSIGLNVPQTEVTVKLIPFRTVSLVTILLILAIAIILSIFSARRMLKPVTLLSQAIETIAQGDLRVQNIAITSNDELGRMAQAYATMNKYLREIITRTMKTVELVSAASEELSASAQQSAQAANQVASSVTEVAQGAEKQLNLVNNTVTIVEQMSAGTHNIATNTNTAAITSEKALDTAKQGSQTMEAAINQMNNLEKTVVNSAAVVAKLGERSKEIGNIVGTIAGIAGQTNLLALNAAIEAARAGEQGRGFAVVADEVRKLAEQSQLAAKQIAELIRDIQIDTDKAVIAMNTGTSEAKAGIAAVDDAGRVFNDIATLIAQISSQAQDASNTIGSIASGSEQIVAAIQGIDQISNETASQTQLVSATTEEQTASMNEIASSSQELAKMAEDLQSIVAKFKL